jgi:hypothetical protein
MRTTYVQADEIHLILISSYLGNYNAMGIDSNRFEVSHPDLPIKRCLSKLLICVYLGLKRHELKSVMGFK